MSAMRPGSQRRLDVSPRQVVLFCAVLAVLAPISFQLNHVTALAFNCAPFSDFQKDSFYQPTGSYALHGWLGNCYGGNFNYYYGGQDSRYSYGGSWHNVSYMSTHLRAWWNGVLQYDQTTYGYNTAYQQLVTPQCGPCSPKADASGYQLVTNQWSWSWYLVIP